MPIKYLLDELRGVTTDTGNLVKDIVVAGARQYCKIRQKYPTLTKTISPVRQAWDDFCNVGGNPPSVTPYQPFTGGQCSGDSYKVTISHVRNSADPCNVEGFLEPPSVLFAQGRIIGLRAVATGNLVGSTCDQPPSSDNPVYPQYVLYLATESSPSYNPNFSIIFFTQFDDVDLTPIARILDVENQTNPDDLCGSPDIIPPDPPVDPADFEFTYIHQQETTNLSETNNYTFNFDPGSISIEQGFTVNVNVEFGRDNSTDSFDINFEPDGVGVAPPPNAVPGGEGGVTSGDNGSAKPKTVYKPPEKESDYDSEDIEEAEDVEVESTDQDIAFVLVDVITPPMGDKTILFSDPENNTFFAGYISWIYVINDRRYRSPEIPIRKTYNIFEAPQGVKNVKIYAVNKAKLSAKILKVTNSSKE